MAATAQCGSTSPGRSAADGTTSSAARAMRARSATFKVTRRTHGDRAYRRLARTLKTALAARTAARDRHPPANKSFPPRAGGGSDPGAGRPAMTIHAPSQPDFFGTDDPLIGLRIRLDRDVDHSQP